MNFIHEEEQRVLECSKLRFLKNTVMRIYLNPENSTLTKVTAIALLLNEFQSLMVVLLMTF